MCNGALLASVPDMAALDIPSSTLPAMQLLETSHSVLLRGEYPSETFHVLARH